MDPRSIAPTSPGYEALFQARVNATVMAGAPWDVPGGTLGWQCSDNYTDLDQGKYIWPSLMGMAWQAWQANDSAALAALVVNANASYGVWAPAAWLNTQKCGTFYKPFNAPGYTSYFLQFYPYILQVAPDQLQTAQLMLMAQGREQSTRIAGNQDPISWEGEFDSENYLWMERLSGLLWDEVFPSTYYGPVYATFLANAARALTRVGRLEWDSTIYMGFTLQPALNVFTYSQNATRVAQARVLLDWLLLTASLKYLDGGMVGPDARCKSFGTLPLEGTAWFYLWLYTTDATYSPSFNESVALSVSQLTSLGQFPYSPYRPPQAVLNLAHRNFSTPVLMRNAKPFYRVDVDQYAAWDGAGPNGRRFEFETLYLERNYTFGSVAAGRPQGNYFWPKFGLYGSGEMPFSEQSVWRLGVLSNGVLPGPQQIFGNTGREYTALSGRSPYEQVGQGSTAMVRAFTATDVAWVAVPNTTTLQTVHTRFGPAVFASFGHGVYAAFLPASAAPSANISLTSFPYPLDGQDATELLWSNFSNASLNAIAMEVATSAAFPTFADFVAFFSARASVAFSPASSSVSFLATTGENVTVQHTGIGNYSMVDGAIVSPAGKYPNVWVNGSFVDFNSFDAYGVVHGEQILSQPWGSGAITANAGGAAYRVSVDALTGLATFETK